MTDNCLFELYNCCITDSKVVGDKLILRCLYMQLEYVNVTFHGVRSSKGLDSLKGRTINYMEETDDGYRLIYIDEAVKPTFIEAQNYNIEWV